MIKTFIYSAALALVTLTSCGGGAKEQKLTGSITIDGSSTVFLISEAMAEEFRAIQPGVEVTVGESGTGGGFKKFTRNEIDICGASRPIKGTEMEDAEKNKIKYLEWEVAYDGLAVVVNPQNTWVDKLTVTELKMMWEPAAQGVIKTWNQIRPEFPAEEIRLYGAGTASGTYDYFTEEICGAKGASRGDYTASENDNQLVTGVAGDKGGLAYFGMAYYEKNQDKLKIVPIDNGSGTGVIPTQETVLNKSYSPLSRPLYIYVNLNALAKPEVKAFVDFYMAQASTLCKEVGYVPCEQSVYDSQKQKLAEAIATLPKE